MQSAAKWRSFLCLSTPFSKGSHVCRNIGQAIQIVEWLKALHAEEFVHGDIRGLNLVFRTLEVYQLISILVAEPAR